MILFAFGLYILFVLRVTLFPIPLYSSLPTIEFPYSPRNLNLLPLNFDECRILRHCLFGSIANVYLTIPFGFGIYFLIRSKKKFFLWISLFIGLFIEITQLVISLLLGFPYRVIDINDVIFNAFGVLIGYILFRLFVWGYFALSKKWRSLKTGVYQYLFDVVNDARTKQED
ncbi:MAG: VanZ family protein [Chloroflexi bacterium]|nr:VanZ family protein [Chloroflexota bacterium]MBT4306312.1 VanZ family protein [Chloroflexota bacterium]MBT5335194.1 VanZ family protein [Chloroflexota bacterium]MBT6988700.1 VanZ family protein [Chloroflexota bacterium]